MIGIIKTLVWWPNGIVLGNLLASAIWATPALIHLHRKIDRHHRELSGKAISEKNDSIVPSNRSDGRNSR